MKFRTFFVYFCGLLFLIFLGLNFAIQKALPNISFDLSEDNNFSLSNGSIEIINSIKEPLEIDLYISQAAINSDPVSEQFSNNLISFLGNYARTSKGKIQIKTKNAESFSQIEDEAISLGLITLRDNENSGANIFLGARIKFANNDLGQVIIPVFNPQNPADIEYQISRAIAELNHPNPKTIGIISNLPWFIQSENGIRTIANSLIAKEIAQNHETIAMRQDFDELPDNLDCLIIAAPWVLNEYQQYLLDQYALSGGHIIIALDPLSSVSADNDKGEIISAQNLGRLYQNWGFGISGDIILDKANALPVETNLNGHKIIAPQPLYISLKSENIAQDDLLSSGITQGLNFATIGEIVKTNSNLHFKPIITTSNQTMRMSALDAKKSPDPQEIAGIWNDDKESHIIAARIDGLVKPSFDAPPSPPARSEMAKRLFGANPRTKEQVKTAIKPVSIVVISDADFLSDSLYQNNSEVAADNASFFLNLVDILSGDARLVNIRSRQPRARNLQIIEQMQAKENERILNNQTALLHEYQTLQNQMKEMGNEADSLQMSQTRDRLFEIRNQLRASLHSISAIYAKLKSIILLFNAVIIPIIILFIGFIYLFMRKKTPIEE